VNTDAAVVEGRPWVVFDVDGVLLDVRPSFYAIIRAMSGATDADIQLFKAAGGYNDDWELARAAYSWIRARRPKPIPPGGWRTLVNRCGNDPGDLAPRCRAMYLAGLWREEQVMVDTERLVRLASRANVAACTGRDRTELALAEERLGFRFPVATTCEDVRKPDPRALLRLAPGGDFFGDSEDDRRCAQAAGFRFHPVTDSPLPALDAILEALGA
jgi:phosphoglycolate phosphatase-like HAD superfamily hydrolase